MSKEIKSIHIIREQEEVGQITAILEFEGNGELLVKTALSPVIQEGAKNNLEAEISHWDFNQTYKMAKTKWNTELGKIHVETTNQADLKTFYTALYHTMIAPSVFNDADGTYRGTDKNIYNENEFVNHSVFSLWDTYRAAHPLYTLVQPNRVNDFVNSMLAIYDQQGKLPIWHLKGNETNTMVGYHSIPVIVDAYFKGFKGFDAEKAFEAMKTSALLDEQGQDFGKSI